MKNYPNFYSGKPRKIGTPQLKSVKNTSASNNVLTEKSSFRTILPYNEIAKRQKQMKERSLARSIEELHICGSEVANGQLQNLDSLGEADEELFSQSYAKIQQIKFSYPTHTIDSQLNQVLTIIKIEKQRIAHQIQVLKANNHQYKQMLSKNAKSLIEFSVNTDSLLDKFQFKSIDCSIQTEQLEESFEGKKMKSESKMAILEKLVNMLDDMGINPSQILPGCSQLKIETKQYKFLSENQIIKIQKFFIKKLIDRMQSS